MWNKVFLLVLDDRGVPLRNCINSYKRRYNIDNKRTINIRTIIDNGGYTGGFAPIFPDTCYHLTHYWLAAVDIPVASDNPVH
ncbi:hypothetical protein NEO12_25850, partial [Escherichia coli]|nr:hypothetical protein [Escherichia coli]MDI0530542.1 hypothetical protein [Escherichia coli]